MDTYLTCTTGSCLDSIVAWYLLFAHRPGPVVREDEERSKLHRPTDSSQCQSFQLVLSLLYDQQKSVGTQHTVHSTSGSGNQT
jgi:hypothetical protein